MSEKQALFWHGGRDRERYLGMRRHEPGVVLWLTGLSGAGKSTLALALEQLLLEEGVAVFRLDGDNVRHGLNGDLGFTLEDRTENVRRLAHVAALMAEAGLTVLVAAISPLRSMRREAARIVGGERFLEVWVRASLKTCSARDPKGLYARVAAGTLDGFTGVDQAYEAPEGPAAVVDTEQQEPAAGVDQLRVLLQDGWARSRRGPASAREGGEAGDPPGAGNSFMRS